MTTWVVLMRRGGAWTEASVWTDRKAALAEAAQLKRKLREGDIRRGLPLSQTYVEARNPVGKGVA